MNFHNTLKILSWVYYCLLFTGLGASSVKALGLGLGSPGSIPGAGGGGVEIFLHSFIYRLSLGTHGASYKMSTVALLE